MQMEVVAVVNDSHPIYALSTPYGRSALCIIRITGTPLPKSFLEYVDLVDKEKGVFVRSLINEGFRDSCVVLNFPAPDSFTGEHIVEIQPHGNPVLIKKIMDVLEDFGLRKAEGGEFAKRSYLNKKISIEEAESIMVTVEAESFEQLSALNDFKEGVLASRVSRISEGLKSVLVEIESQLDFSDEGGVEAVEKESINKKICASEEDLKQLLVDYAPYEKEETRGRVVLAGKPNVGKSSLFNALVGADVAIVSDEAGTTRDVVRKNIIIEGVEYQIEDTAGIREAKGEVEEKGIAKTSEAIAGSDLTIRVFDNVREISSAKTNDKELLVLNKRDLFDEAKLKGFLSVSAITGDGISSLKEKIKKFIDVPFKRKLVSDRVFKRLEKSVLILSSKASGSDALELRAQQLRDVLNNLNEITGGIDNEEILGEIFNKFCIGK